MRKISLLKTLSAMNFLIKGNGLRTKKLAGDQSINKLELESCIFVNAGTLAIKIPRAVSAGPDYIPILPITPIKGSQG